MRKLMLVLLMMSAFACTPDNQSKGEKKTIQAGDELQAKEELFLSLPPASELSLKSDSSLKVVQHDVLEKDKKVITTEIKLIRGGLKVNTLPTEEMDIDQRIVTDDVSIRSTAGEFEVTIGDETVLMKVYTGQIQVSSPYVQSFVPEIVNGGETLIFSRIERKFLPRKEGNR